MRTYEVLEEGKAIGVVFLTPHGWSGRLMPPSGYEEFARTAGKPVVRQLRGKREEVATLVRLAEASRRTSTAELTGL